MLDENIVRDVHAKNTCIRQRGITVCNVDYKGKVIYINKEALMHLSGVTFSRSIRSVTEALNLPVIWKVCRKLMYALPDFKLENGKLVNSGGRVLGVSSTAATLEEAIKKAYAGAEKVKFENAFYRRDIGAKAMKILMEGNN